ncbi:MAG: hypothetical protein ABGW81_06670 [Paracoccaceae bacterium]
MDNEYAIALCSGQAVGLIRAASTTEVFNDLVTQTNEALTLLT